VGSRKKWANLIFGLPILIRSLVLMEGMGDTSTSNAL
jgi:hypothetical protein